MIPPVHFPFGIIHFSFAIAGARRVINGKWQMKNRK
jgi:hypothetical protein